jgi:hypothetical protein
MSTIRSLVFDHRRHSSIADDSHLVVSTASRVASAFPGALTNDRLVKKVSSILKSQDYSKDTTLLGSSLCCDEVCRQLEQDFATHYKCQHVFLIGGLAGFPFSGPTAFRTMTQHIPDEGNLLFIYASHVGINSAGHVGVVTRRGQEKASSACCGSANAAAESVARTSRATRPSSEKFGPFDQQGFVEACLFDHKDRLHLANNPKEELPLVIFEMQKKIVCSLVETNPTAIVRTNPNGKVAVLGGVQINTPDGVSDYFLPLHFDVYSNRGTVLENLLWNS